MFVRRFSESVEFAVPGPYAYAFLTDVSTGKEIDPAVIEYVSEPYPPRIGTINRICFRMWGLRWRATTIVEELVENCRCVIRSLKPSWPLKMRVVHSFESTASGCTYTWAMEFTTRNPIGIPLAIMMNRFFHENARAQQRRFKAIVERRFKESSGAVGPAGGSTALD
jgi:hypothetical protein